ncbi:MAG: helix-turn-helix domain-containing protein [Actinomycetota bacterium]
MTANEPTLHRSRSAGRVLALLDLVVTDGPLTLTELARRVEMATSTTLRHLHVLSDGGYVVKTEHGQYSVGPSFLRLSLSAFRAGPYADLTAAARPGLQRLVELTEESAYLAVRDGSEAVYIDTVEGTRAIRHVGWVGRSVPIAGTAVGDALLSPVDGHNEEPTAVLNTGAIESDVTAVAAPIFGRDQVLGAFSILGPSDRLKGRHRSATADAVAEIAGQTARALRGSAWPGG